MGLFEIDENPSGEKVLVICIPKTQLRFEITQNPENFHEFCCLFTKFAPVASDYGQAPTNGWASIEAIYSWFEFWLDNEIKVYVEEYECNSEISYLTVGIEKEGEYIQEIRFGTEKVYPTNID